MKLFKKIIPEDIEPQQASIRQLIKNDNNYNEEFARELSSISIIITEIGTFLY